MLSSIPVNRYFVSKETWSHILSPKNTNNLQYILTLNVKNVLS